LPTFCATTSCKARGRRMMRMRSGVCTYMT
jgi:hypothetical protein